MPQDKKGIGSPETTIGVDPAGLGACWDNHSEQVRQASAADHVKQKYVLLPVDVQRPGRKEMPAAAVVQPPPPRPVVMKASSPATVARPRRPANRRDCYPSLDAHFDVLHPTLDEMWKKHSLLIHKFYEIAERKVGVLDEYGDQSWSQLPKCIEECVFKIAEREGFQRRDVRKWLRSRKSTEWRYRLFVGLSERLDREFRAFHANRKPDLSRTTQLDELSGEEFEAHLALWLPLFGFEDVRGTPKGGDQGADLLARRDGLRVVIQAKRYSASVGNRAVQEVVAALSYYKGDEAWVITNSTFTRAAVALARANHVQLIDGAELHAWKSRVGVRPEVP